MCAKMARTRRAKDSYAAAVCLQGFHTSHLFQHAVLSESHGLLGGCTDAKALAKLRPQLISLGRHPHSRALIILQGASQSGCPRSTGRCSNG